MTVLEQVAFDIETTGFHVGDAVTVIGFALPMGCRVFLNTGDQDTTGVEAGVQAASPEHVVLSCHDSERALFDAVTEFTRDRLQGDDVLLVAYNGERWRGGFDLPFLRTRLALTDLPWPFTDIPYADVMPVIERRFNTTVDDSEHSDLVSVYATLCEEGYGEVDPFADSATAVDAFHDGAFVDLVQHNVADILRTRALGRLAEQYCGKSEFSVKSLTPIQDATDPPT
jgi:uncharacterized protein YprB with RNaseH-like and TPR domain